MSDFINPILQWLNLHPNLAGLFTFIISAAESIAIIGTIVPGSVMMTAIGALAGAGVINLWSTIVWAILGAIVGDGISYWMGRSFKDKLPYAWPFGTRPDLLRRGESFFRKYGHMSVFIGRFVGPVRALVPLVAGMLGMNPWEFYIANITSAIGWAPAYMLPGILLGAASLELSPDLAVHGILVILLVTLFIILCIWVIYKLFVLISLQVDNLLNKIWFRLAHSRYFSFITAALKYHDSEKPHGQLALAFYFLVFTIAFLYLAFYVASHGSANISLNNSLYYLFRSWRTPLVDHIMLAVTFLGDSLVLTPLTITIFAWLAYKRYWYTAAHVILLAVLTTCGIEGFKHLVHSVRPWGIFHSPMSSSFPSGHTTLATIYYVGIGLLITQAYQIKRDNPLFIFLGIIVIAVAISRMYLGAHWFTDVLGGWLLGSAILIFVLLSYKRRKTKTFNPRGLFLTIIITLAVSYSANYFLREAKAQQNYAQIDWPVYTMTADSWWNQTDEHLPRVRINRFGYSTEVLNLQWQANLAAIQSLLQQNGWETPPERDWISIFQRLADIQSAEHLPLVSALYLDKTPVLVLTKKIAGDKKLIVLRLWNSHLLIKDSTLPLWVGTVDVAPRTYSWLFNRKKQLTLTSKLLFNQIPKNYEIKSVIIAVHHRHHDREQTILLIKPTK